MATAFFEREFKALFKKHRSLKSDLTELIEQLEQNPKIGTEISHGCYKIRLAITSKRTGKSGGARVITHVRIFENSVYLISIYDKSDIPNISERTILERLKRLSQEK